MGSVYLAEHPVLKHNVAIKILANGGKSFFDRSRRILEKLSHPGFVKVFSYGEHEGHPYLVYEYLQGAFQLRAWLNRPETRGHWDLLQIMVQMANAIAYAHGQGIVIGYIEPNNHILVMSNGAPVLLDAGLFQHAQQNHFEEMEAYPSRYLAPECVKGEPATKETDIWNLGVLMHEHVAEKPLFDGDSGEEIRQAIQSPDPVDLSALKDVAPDYIVHIVKKCLRKAPQERFSSVADLRDALEEALFADLVRLKDYDTERLLRDVEPEALAAALTGATEQITAHMLGHVPDKVSKQIQRLITVNAAAAEAAHAARREIVSTATRLLQELRIDFQSSKYFLRTLYRLGVVETFDGTL
ncbi:MAG: serine/threonine protein kinase [Candidatus Hydrogenedentes bacterium]|nr:serine/threonine protein kinase [Candidatus Hydrogenedentota bacterium]